MRTHDATAILEAIEAGDPHAAGKLLPLVYDELRRLAAAKIPMPPDSSSCAIMRALRRRSRRRLEPTSRLDLPLVELRPGLARRPPLSRTLPEGEGRNAGAARLNDPRRPIAKPQAEDLHGNAA
ncbi:MAG: hypothetical protein K2X38_23675 [Gemmataceae bacterium]|nr:hypothetical protein [Gemmataceae bacterium]